MPVTEDPVLLPRRDAGRTLPQAEALAYLQGLEDGELQRTRSLRTPATGWSPGPDSTEPGDDTLDAAEDDEALRVQHRRGERVLSVLEAATLRTEERLAELDAHASRLEACVASAESLVRALGGRPGYLAPRTAERIEVQEDRIDDVEYPVDPVLDDDVPSTASPAEGEPDPAGDAAIATSGI